MEIREQLYNKIEREYKDFINKLMEKDPEEIISHSYEIVIKEEMMSELSSFNECYDLAELKALNKCKRPLDQLYQDWLDCDHGIHEVLSESICNSLENLAANHKNIKEISR